MMRSMDQPPFAPRQKDYFGEALLTAALYFIGVYFIGLIANLLFLYRARQDKAQGVLVHNAGCLDALLVLALLPIAVMFGAAVFSLLQQMF